MEAIKIEMNLNEEVIIANELAGKNDWVKISQQNLTLEFIKKFQDKLRPESLSVENLSIIPEDLLLEMYEKADMRFAHSSFWHRVINYKSLSREFILKIAPKMSYKNRDIMLRKYKKNCKFKKKELLKYFIDQDDRPQIGMGATISYGSDCYPYTIIDINKSGTVIKIQADDFKRTDKNGLSEDQEYEYIKNENGTIVEVSLRSNLRWVVKNGTTGIKIGYKRAYQDPHF